MNTDVIAMGAVALALALYWAFHARHRPKRSSFHFPHYRFIEEHLSASQYAVFFLFLGGWFASMWFVWSLGNEALTASVWAGSIVCFLLWRSISVLHRKCVACGSAVAIFREGPPFQENYSGVQYLIVCHTCKSMRLDTMIKSVDGG